VGGSYTTGYRPQCLVQIEAAGISLRENLFDAKSVVV
jgi:hypothetical protein